MIADSNTITCQWVRTVLMVLVLLVCVGESFLFKGISRGGNRMISTSVYVRRSYTRTKKDEADDGLRDDAQQGKDALVQDGDKWSLSSEMKIDDLQSEMESSDVSSGMSSYR